MTLVVEPWRESLRKPIVQMENPYWSIKKLEQILLKVIGNYAEEYLYRNHGVIHTTLSGGIDSSLCLAIIRKVLGDGVEIRTYTIGGSSHHPDLIFAKKVAETFKTVHRSFIPKKRMIDAARIGLMSIFPNISREQIQDCLGVYLVYNEISQSALPGSFILAHDGIDELMGGYWRHRATNDLRKKKAAFRYFWQRLYPDHLVPLMQIAHNRGLNVELPYMDPEIVEYISHIPVQDRTGRDISKIPLRKIAEKYLPKEIIERRKLGFCDATKKEAFR